jgi:oxygen-independent coproporphyrinogen-3 oxidase
MKSTNSLYIHFPFCLHLCNYCDFYKHKLSNRTDISDITEFVDKQLNYIKSFHSEHNSQIEELKTLYIGGGTPSLWGSEGSSFFKKLMGEKRLVLGESCEFTLEVDPGTITKDELEKWKIVGVNRLSIGVQSFDSIFLEIMDRIHGQNEINELMSYSSLIISNFSFDLMIGLPNSAEKSRDVVSEIKELVKFNPKHFSVYILKTRSNYIHKKNLPDDEYIEAEYLTVCKTLEDLGYIQYEVSNFALPGYESKHNIKYWNSESVAAIGPNATGLIVKDNEALRYQLKSKSLGISVENLDKEALDLEELYMKFRTSEGVDLSKYISHENIGILIKKWTNSLYVKRQSNHNIVLNSKGFLMLDSLMDDIFNCQ